MNAHEVFRALVGGTVVYAVVASCSPEAGRSPVVTTTGDAAAANGGAIASAAGGGGPGSGGAGLPANGGGTAVDGASILDAAIDRILDPVPDARADPNTSGTRLRARYLVGSDGSRQFAGWRDTERNEDCSFMTAADGVQRCLPVGVSALPNYFSDAGCTQPVVLSYASGCGSPLPKYASRYSSDGCSLQYTVFLTGARVTTGNVYTGTPAACVAQQVSALTAGGAEIYATGTEVQPSSFVSASETVE